MRLPHNYSIALESATKENNPQSSSVKTREEKEQALRIGMQHCAGPVSVFEAARLSVRTLIIRTLSGPAGK
jgi:hypothetical protein